MPSYLCHFLPFVVGLDDDHNLGICGWFLTVVSFIITLCTIPFSLFFCLKVSKVVLFTMSLFVQRIFEVFLVIRPNFYHHFLHSQLFQSWHISLERALEQVSLCNIFKRPNLISHRSDLHYALCNKDTLSIMHYVTKISHLLWSVNLCGANWLQDATPYESGHSKYKYPQGGN